MHTVISLICLIWFIVVWLVCAIGVIQLFRYYSRKPAPAICLTDLNEDDVPHVTIIRPVKGLEPRLYECLAATFRTTYPKSKLTISFCISSRSDPALPILLQLLHDFPEFDARLYVEDEDPLLRDDSEALGPNPKIRNMSRAYKEAKGDIVWILDCNVWVGKGVCGRLVDLLCGFGKGIQYKFVHQTPLTIDLDGQDMSSEDRNQLLGGHQSTTVDLAASTSSDPRNHARGRFRKLMQRGGGRLDEAFMSSAHAKFYNAINTVLVAPCVMGKSTMFRRSHLNYATRGTPGRSPGLDVFSDNICEDHLIGDALWKKPQPFEERGYQPAPGEHIGRWGKHGMLFGDFCFQPMSHTSVIATIDRRVRWLRVRKFTVTAATFVEPGTEAIVCSLFGAYALTSLAIFPESLVSQTWSAFAVVWLLSMSAWCLVDYIQYLLLHSTKTIEVDEHTPDFILPQRLNAPVSTSTSKTPLLNTDYRTPSLLDGRRRTFRQWWFAWVGRELSAFPIWTWAFWGGVTVEWRGRKFWVGLDMKVHEIQPK
ncbi:glycosyltransferase family 21 protein [Aaosphaeria arxii CBS 175.79]|uniref:Ceramide glucosyltransferase n=1 Tax=Aaosphaeria arxii CBS 175.79 TaxID=1450172 RepID=A0A6A5Y8K9_9PLEO|nr:glycosyltransferase family 21 protein [Aaosphaeria arxii CBS 175.79]KAF2021150.1 glycosyltransferase family 21 protein [Aaosphaeria arxii CBS 175.79]